MEGWREVLEVGGVVFFFWVESRKRGALPGGGVRVEKEWEVGHVASF